MSQPRIVPSITQTQAPEEVFDFSVVLGGPLYELFISTRLMRPALELLIRRIVIITIICWLPLLLLSAIGGHLTAGVSVSFLRDPELHIRFLLALPLLIASEVFVHRRLRIIVPQFLSRDLVAPQDRARFEKIVASAMRLRNSVVAEIILLVLVLTLGYWIWNRNFTLTTSTWYRIFDEGVPRLTAAGLYYAFVSLTIFRFILIRWYFRLFIWYRFLWQVSRMPLQFNLFHPDRSGGLGFLSASIEIFAPVFIAQTIVIATNILDNILYGRERLQDFQTEIAGMLVFVVFLMVLPLAFFCVRLERAARIARREFGTFASQYVIDFRRKWMEAGAGGGEQLLGTPDLQSLADLSNSFKVAVEMRLLPVSKQAVMRLIVMVGLPFVPLLLTMIPLHELIHRLFKLAF